MKGSSVQVRSPASHRSSGMRLPRGGRFASGGQGRGKGPAARGARRSHVGLVEGGGMEMKARARAGPQDGSLARARRPCGCCALHGKLILPAGIEAWQTVGAHRGMARLVPGPLFDGVRVSGSARRRGAMLRGAGTREGLDLPISRRSATTNAVFPMNSTEVGRSRPRTTAPEGAVPLTPPAAVFGNAGEPVGAGPRSRPRGAYRPRPRPTPRRRASGHRTPTAALPDFDGRTTWRSLSGAESVRPRRWRPCRRDLEPSERCSTRSAGRCRRRG